MISFLLCVLYRPPHLGQIKTSFGFLQSAKVLFGSFPTNINEKSDFSLSGCEGTLFTFRNGKTKVKNKLFMLIDRGFLMDHLVFNR